MVYATIIQFSKQFVSVYVKISIKSRPGKKRQSLEHIFCTSKYQRGIDFIFKNNCQSDLKEMTSWGSTYFFHFCGRVSSKYWLLLRMWAELILLAANFPTRMTLMYLYMLSL